MIGAVLNGGGSSRMGVDKAHLVFEGRTLLERAVDLVGAVTGRVIVVGGTEAPTDVPLVADAVPGAGPLSGLAAALSHADGRDVLCLAVDLPLVTDATLRALATASLMGGQAKVARSAGRLHPLCGAYSGSLTDPARSHLASDDRSMMAFVRAVPVLSLVDVPDDEMMNVNTPDDLLVLASQRAISRAEVRQNG